MRIKKVTALYTNIGRTGTSRTYSKAQHLDAVTFTESNRKGGEDWLGDVGLKVDMPPEFMKATGIVRRIDDLGRVVIPKEIRRTMKIREGEPLEIFVDREGEVILKKYSPIGELGEFAQEYADSLAEVTNHVACILDKDAVVAVAGAPRKEYLEKPVSRAAQKVLETGETTIINEPGAHAFCDGCKSEAENCKFSSTVLAPIKISDGQMVGLVVLSSRTPDVNMGELEVKLANTAAGFLAKQMES